MTPQYPDLISESELLATVLGLAQTYGWLTYHTRDSRQSNTGMPDVVLARAPDLLLFELKDEKGKLSKGRYSKKGNYLPGQEDWLKVLASCTRLKSGLWRPCQLAEIEEMLQ
jgi:hypothetical protein